MDLTSLWIISGRGFQMLKCDNCGKVIYDDEMTTHQEERGDIYFETVDDDCSCGGYFLKAEQCDECGEYFIKGQNCSCMEVKEDAE